MRPVRDSSRLVGLHASFHPFSLDIDGQRKYLSHRRPAEMINTGTASETWSPPSATAEALGKAEGIEPSIPIAQAPSRAGCRQEVASDSSQCAGAMAALSPATFCFPNLPALLQPNSKALRPRTHPLCTLTASEGADSSVCILKQMGKQAQHQ